MRKHIYSLSFLFVSLFFTSMSFAQEIAVKFSVDMANENVDGSVNMLWVYDLTEQPNIVPLTKNGTVWSATVDFDISSTIYYLFINGPFVGNTSKFEYVSDDCAYTEQPGMRTRTATFGITDTEIPSVCFGACGACPSQVTSKFSVDMAVLGAELANNVTLYVTKDFSATPTFVPMSKVGTTTVWEATTNLDENAEYYYIFMNGDPTSQAFDNEKDLEKGFGLANCGEEVGDNVYARKVTTTTGSMDLETVCYGLCGDCTTNYGVDVEVDMEDVELSGKSVYAKYYVSAFVNGTVELTKDENTNVWSGEIPSPAGVKLAYTFSVGNPDVDGVVEELSGLDCVKSLGADNYRVVEMVDKDMTLPKVCFSTCAACITGNSDLGSLDSEVNIYPNPLSSELNINISGKQSNVYTIEIINTLGAIVSTDIFETSIGRFTKDVRSLTNGLYFVKISTNEGFSTQKFIKK